MKEEKIKFIDILNTAKTYSSLFFILFIITIITPIALLITIIFDKKRKLYLLLTRFFIKFFFILNWVNLKKRIDFNGIENPKKGEKRIYVINHASLIDGLLLFLLPGEIKFMAKDTYAKIPIFGLGVSLTGNVSVEKGNEGKQLNIYFKAAEILDAYYPLVIFPEGHRSRTSKIQRFQNSAFMLALEKKADIIPVVFDTWNVLRPNSFIIRDLNFRVKILDRIKYDNIKKLKYKELALLVRIKIMEEQLRINNERKNASSKFYRNLKKYEEIDIQMKEELENLKKKIKSFNNDFIEFK